MKCLQNRSFGVILIAHVILHSNRKSVALLALFSFLMDLILQEVMHSQRSISKGAEEEGEGEPSYLLSLEGCYVHSS